MSTFIVAEATPKRFNEVTGQVQGRGFVLHRGLPGGLYPDDMAQHLHDLLVNAEINHHITPAESVNEGLRKVFGE